MSAISQIRILQLTAQRSMLQGKLMQNTIACHRLISSPSFTGRHTPPTELPYVMNNIVIECQLRMIEEELRNLKKQGTKLDYLA